MSLVNLLVCKEKVDDVFEHEMEHEGSVSASIKKSRSGQTPVMPCDRLVREERNAEKKYRYTRSGWF